ncbi:MAG: hypothetical protein JSU07_03050 [Bacteroidetes bacterium]|nr:hypothetical protein [Bacteroidota bacterium]
MKEKLKLIKLCCLIVAIFPACILFKKQINKPVSININESNITPQVIAKAIVPKYCFKINPQQLVDSFWVGFYREAALTKNVTVLKNNPDCNYNYSLKAMIITETGKLDTIKNIKSKYNNEVLELSTIDCKVEVSYKNNKHPNLIETISDNKSQTENLSNNRTLDEIFSGQNKNNDVYHVKLLDNNEYYRIAERLGHRIWVPITRALSRAEK